MPTNYIHLLSHLSQLMFVVVGVNETNKLGRCKTIPILQHLKALACYANPPV